MPRLKYFENLLKNRFMADNTLKIEKPKEEEKDHDVLRERLEDLVKVTVLVWSAALLTFSYVRLPDGKRILEFDPTFIASVFSGALASFGMATAAKKNGGGNGNGNGNAQGGPPPVASAIEPKK